MPDPARVDGALRRALRAVVRVPRLLLHVAIGLSMALAVRLSFGRLRPEPLMQWWSRRVLPILGVDVAVHGDVPPGGHLVVANHVSWLDISILSACLPTRFISKSEVRRWPVAGMLATASGTFFLRRGKGGVRPLLDKLVPFLASGGWVTLYPEGTTTAGEDVLPFHPRLFAAAIESERPVLPVALRYACGDGGAAIAPFVGDDTLVSHIVRLLLNRRLAVRVVFCEPVTGASPRREELADASRDRIRAALRWGQADVAGAPAAANGASLAA